MINCIMPVLLSVDKWRVPVFPSSVSNELSKLLLRRGGSHVGPPDPAVSVDGGVCASKRGCGAGRCSAGDPTMGLWHMNVPGKPLPGLGPAVGLAPRRQSRPGMAPEPCKGELPPNQGTTKLPDPCRCPAVLCVWGREVTPGEPGLGQGTAWPAGLPGEAQAVVQCFGTALARALGARRFSGPWCPHARAWPPLSVLREGWV